MVSIWGSAAKNKLKPLQSIQNRCIKAVYNKDRLFSTETLYTEADLSILPIMALKEIQTVCNMHNLLHNQQAHHNIVLSQRDDPHYTRNRDQLFVSRCRTETGKKSFNYYGKTRYNLLPSSIKNQLNFQKFKQLVKSHVKADVRQFIL